MSASALWPTNARRRRYLSRAHRLAATLARLHSDVLIFGGGNACLHNTLPVRTPYLGMAARFGGIYNGHGRPAPSPTQPNSRFLNNWRPMHTSWRKLPRDRLLAWPWGVGRLIRDRQYPLLLQHGEILRTKNLYFSLHQPTLAAQANRNGRGEPRSSSIKDI